LQGKKKYRVAVTDSADGMLVEHAVFLARASIEAADGLLSQFDKMAARIADNPFQFPIADELDVMGTLPGTYRKCLFGSLKSFGAISMGAISPLGKPLMGDLGGARGARTSMGIAHACEDSPRKAFRRLFRASANNLPAADAPSGAACPARRPNSAPPVSGARSACGGFSRPCGAGPLCHQWSCAMPQFFPPACGAAFRHIRWAAG
jgi:hypothetical protein